MAWTDKDEQSWFQSWWLRRYPQDNTLDAVHERKARFRGFWSDSTRLFPRHESRPGFRWLSTRQKNAAESWFDEHDILTACPVPGKKGLTPAAGTTEVSVTRAEGQVASFTRQEADQITAESVLSFGKKMRSLLRTTSFRRLQPGNVRHTESDELGF